jgi:hypothetical protein
VLGTPVYTALAARLGGVDERLVAQGRLRPLTSAGDIVLEHKPAGASERVRRDPAQLVDLALSGLTGA